ncbi:helix-turn-helix domain-containing protein [Pseudomonas monteilii]|uniref:helix-turn-helix domain-containing protein n=1 Tax=Pseudomonas putida group TaxID=136845 RepID=UPI0007DD685D|nr:MULTISPECIES: helix-turn-helix domain-containing protein [Pseudomonas putida group]ANI33835.1 prophage PSPPH03, Cro/CI family transcriptional regulator [Pseudomonas sp. JY-Q]MCE1020516.1 helix-turn-helix domain-containing protein [Pseudomonas monteilii]MCE1037916.1 helix-turn-helix domain-containing protein [Pseudomonas monteilii]MCE1089993.1 helix-turn-helix domain-containing protein [Pseudomonas monteilii]PJX09734.1 Cro/Cl family transcriptional regulator [Pseudomonas putida]
MNSDKLWPWEEAECVALYKALKDFNGSAPRAERITQHKLAEAMGVSTVTARRFLKGDRPLNTAIALAFQGLTGIPVRSFSPRLADDIEESRAVGDAAW